MKLSCGAEIAVETLSRDEQRALLRELKAAFGADPLDARDEAVRAALDFYAGPPTRRAKVLAIDWRRYLASGGLRELELAAPPAPASEKRKAMHRIVRLSNGRALGWRQIVHIAAGHRGR